nr:Uncharacterised protein [Streptococcus thermophilus]
MAENKATHTTGTNSSGGHPGLTVSRMMTDKTWAFSRYIDFNAKLDGTARPINA